MRFPRTFLPIGLGPLLFGIGLALPVSGEPVPFTEETVVIGTQADSGLPNDITGDRGPADPEAAPPGGNAGAGARSSYSVVRGDTLSGIAGRLLGDPRRYRELVRVNAARYPSLLKNPNLILVGWTLELPGGATPDGPATETMTNRAGTADPRRDSSETGPNAAGPTDPARPEPAPPTPPNGQPQAASEAGRGGPLITPASRVLHIGDSHTVGIYGSAMDATMRATGAKVQSVGVAGSSPSWWLKGTVTRCGFSARDEKGRLDQPADWRTPRATPLLPNLIDQFKPTVIVVSLGANLIGASPERVRSEVQSLMAVAKRSGASIVWVGPPNGREANKPSSRQDQLYRNLQAALGPDVTFIDSRPVTRYPATGGDGIHYWGAEGTRIAREWAGKTFDSIQHSGPAAK